MDLEVEVMRVVEGGVSLLAAMAEAVVKEVVEEVMVEVVMVVVVMEVVVVAGVMVGEAMALVVVAEASAHMQSLHNSSAATKQLHTLWATFVLGVPVCNSGDQKT